MTEGAAGQERFDRLRARVALVLGPLLFVTLLLLPLPLEPGAHRLAAVMALVVVFWIGEPVPVAVTALLGPTLALLIGAVPRAAKAADLPAAVFSKFGDPILMLFIGGFFIAEAMQVHGLDRRIAMRILSFRPMSSSPARMIVGLGVTSALLSMWMSNTATTALLIPISLGMLAIARGAASGGRLDQSTMLMLPFAATVGGLGTPVGTAPNIIGKAQINALPGPDISFLQWMLLALPIIVMMQLALSWILTRRLPRVDVDLHEHARKVRAELGPWKRGEIVAAASFGLAVTLWVISGVVQIWKGSKLEIWFQSHLSEAAIALLASSILFMIPAAPGRPTLTWREATRIDWGTLLLLGGGMSLGELMRSTGLAERIGTGVATGLDMKSTWSLMVMSAGLAIVLSEITSNTATVTMLLPVVIGIGQSAGVNPMPAALATTFACSFGFMLPVSTPPNALAYGTGLIPISVMARRGVIFDVLGFLIIIVGMRVMCPLFGFA